MSFVAQAEAALEQRAALFEQRKAVAADTSIPRSDILTKLKAIDDQMDALEAEARSHFEAHKREVKLIEERADAARLAAGRDISTFNRYAPSVNQWRSLFPTEQEYRATVAEATSTTGGVTVPAQVANYWIDKLRSQSVFMKAPGLNVIHFNTNNFTIPQLSTSTDLSGTTYSEGAVIGEGAMTWSGVQLAPVKYGRIYVASSEIIEDSAINIEQMAADVVSRDLALALDKDCFQGAGGTTALGGLSLPANSTATTLSTGNTSVTWDNIIDAYAAIVSTGATPTVVWASPDMFKGLAKARENGSTGGYLAASVTSNPVSEALGLPLLVSGNLPARTVIVADATRLYIGIRRDVKVERSSDARFAEDLVSFKATFRVAGVKAAEATSIQRIVASAT
ncbi:phage major capsid protein [Actinoplanes oblitus]|uniref:Phage major capsid protein n=1 Tax=Actinoplanes oblitus TaxID=3040509 RepID=A0ABY8WAU8_9ACTN|nr:phage major capsid protein [Actinoplanes oblitus]WIM94261.1 phage major capsid protein [Actinoplanes oblitus]